MEGRLCTRCALEISGDVPGEACKGCHLPHHLACMAQAKRGNSLCAGCMPKQSAADMGNRFSLNLPAPGASSTTVGGQGESQDGVLEGIQRQMEAMQATMIQMQEAISRVGRESIATGSRATIAQVDNEQSDGDMSDRSSVTGRGLNKTQATILASIKAKPITKAEQEYRRSGAELPHFTGDPTTWFVFISSYRESTIQCGFSPCENLKRVKGALGEPARGHVSHFFEMPHRLQQLLDALEEEYGTPEALQQHVTRLAWDMPPLADNLSNVGEFFAVVLKMSDALELLEDPTECPGLTNALVRKIGMQRGLDWLHFLGKRRATIQVFQSFIGELCTNFQKLRSLGSEPAGSSRAVSGATSRDSTGWTASNRTGAKPKTRVMVHEDRGPPKLAKADALEGLKCPLGCIGQHKLDGCDKFRAMTVNGRWDVVKRFEKCTYCFGGHYQAKCRKAQRCPYPGCTYRHNQLLHKENGPGAHKKTSDAFIGVAKNGEKGTFFAVVKVVLENNGRRVPTYALLDTGSSTTFIRTELARRLGLRGPSSVMTVAWADTQQQDLRTERLTVKLSGHPGEGHTIQAQTMDDLALPAHHLTREMVEKEGFADLPLSLANDAVPQLLLGLDNAELLASMEMAVGKSRGVVATRTKLGWVVMGQVGQAKAAQCLFVREDRRLEELVEQYIEADDFGLVEDAPRRLSNDNERAMELMQQLTHLVGDRYETGLLWKEEHRLLPDSLPAAEQRHQGLIRKLRKDPEMWRKLDATVEDYIAKGYAKEVVEKVRPEQVWYLPVFAVKNPNKPEKVRLVMDGAAQVKGVSLNSHLLTGPDLNAPLVHVLLKFRRGKVAVSGDIREMFHQVRIRAEDRSAQRFMWQFSTDEQPRTYEMQVMVFGAACSPTLAQYAKNVNAARFADEFPEAAKAIVEQHYVDDYLDSHETAERALQVAQEVKHIHQRGGFCITKLVSNDKAVTRALGGDEEQVIEVSSTGTLGLDWDTSNDCFSFRGRVAKMRKEFAAGRLPTKRQLLRMAMSLFDPLGMVAYITVVARILLREAWRTETEWDQQIPISCIRAWEEWVECLEGVHNIPIPRWYGELGVAVELHVFVDASESAIGAVVYAVNRRGPGDATVAMVMAKCRVAPLRTKSIPRLELDAAVLGVRTLGIVVAAKCWDVERVQLWSDARDVLYWIRCHKRRYSSYVANRVGTILRHTKVEQWRWTPTDQNPADWATKNVRDKGDGALWLRGPEFLQHEEQKWPDCERPPEEILETVLMVQPAVASAVLPPVDRFSTWERFVRNVACVRRMIRMCKRKASAGKISSEELEAAQALIIMDVQQQLTERELRQWSAFKDAQGLWRMRGRTAQAEFLSVDEKFPLILPTGSRVTQLIVDRYHRVGQHCLDQRVLQEIRRKFIFKHPRRMLNRVVKQCQYCVLQRARPVAPEMAALPAARLAAYKRPFTYTGTDLFGPFVVKVGRRREKRWGVIFTCLTTRAIYLDLVASPSAAASMMAMDGLAARRGAPRQYRSDNGTNFVAAAKKYVDPTGRRPEWVFNAPNAPHTGGVWERMIGLTKMVMQRMGLEEEPSEERLRWLLSRAEYLINSRPLVEIGIADGDRAMTPNDALFGPEGVEVDNTPMPDDFQESSLGERDAWVQTFWRWWTTAYLPTIAGRTKWQAKRENLAVGDVVYLCEGDYRYGWRKGRIIEAAVDDESMQVRQVVVKTADGSVYRRHATKVAPIVRTT